MATLRDAGDLLGALEEYRRLERRLLLDLGGEPSAGMRRFVTQLRTELAESKARAGALPLPTTTFIGRSNECAAAIAALRERRHAQLVGPAGVGKSRIAFRVARLAQREFDASIAYLALEAVAPGDFEAHLAAALAIESTTETSLRLALVQALARRETLIVLDGCEAVADEVAAFVDAVLEHTRSVRIISATRRRFSAGGKVISIAPLGVPQAGTLSLVGEETAIDFFVDRAARVVPGFTLDERSARLVADVCRRLDGLPLALELAASRLSLMTLEQLDRRLEDRFALLTTSTSHSHERSLREAVQFSFDLLDEVQRRAFVRLGVFCDGWSLEAAEEVLSGEDLPAGRVLETLGALRDRSLVGTSEIGGAIRYGFLETVRVFSETRLKALPEEHRLRRRRHAEFYRDLLDRLADRVARVEPAALSAIDLEFSNVHAALNWASEEDGVPRIGIEMLNALRRYVHVRGLSPSFLPLAERLLETVGPEQRTTAWYGQGLRTAGTWATYGEHPRAYEYHRRAVEIFETLGDDLALAQGLSSLATAAYRRGDYDECEALFVRALPLYERCNARAGIFLCRKNIGSVLSAVGRLDEADAMLAAAIEARDGASDFDYENLVNNRSNLAYLRGDYAAGIALAREALDLSRRQGWRLLEATDLLALNTFFAGERGAAWRIFREAFRYARTHDVPQSIAQILEDAAVCGSAAGFEAAALARALGHAAAVRARSRNPVNPSFAPVLAATEAQLRKRLGKHAFETALAAGESMALGDVLDGLDAPAAAAEEPETIGGLTARESEIARLVAAGKRSSEIAEMLCVSVRTVDNHLAAIYRKLGVKSRAQMVALLRTPKNGG